MMDYNIRHGRTYMYASAKPLYAFGFGLSYTSFAYTALKIDRARMDTGKTANVSFSVKNTGAREGDEVAQLYIVHQGSSMARPTQELKGFQRIHLKPGESRTVTLPLSAESLAYWDESKQAFTLERDTIEVRAGSSSDNLPLRTTLAAGH